MTNADASVRYTTEVPATFPTTTVGSLVFNSYTDGVVNVSVTGTIAMTCTHVSMSMHDCVMNGTLRTIGVETVVNIVFDQCTVTFRNGTVSYTGTVTVGGTVYSFADLALGLL